jgi:hypothetical protein
MLSSDPSSVVVASEAERYDSRTPGSSPADSARSTASSKMRVVAVAVGMIDASSPISARAVCTSPKVMPPPELGFGAAIERTAGEQPVIALGASLQVPGGTLRKSSLMGTAAMMGLDWRPLSTASRKPGCGAQDPGATRATPLDCG